jgi:hypothetical protein
VSEANTERASGSERNELGALAETTPEAGPNPVTNVRFNSLGIAQIFKTHMLKVNLMVYLCIGVMATIANRRRSFAFQQPFHLVSYK